MHLFSLFRSCYYIRPDDLVWPKWVGGSAGLHFRFLYIYYFASYLSVMGGKEGVGSLIDQRSQCLAWDCLYICLRYGIWLSGRLGDLCSCIMIVLVVDKSNNAYLLLAESISSCRAIVYSRPNKHPHCISEHRANTG